MLQFYIQPFNLNKNDKCYLLLLVLCNTFYYFENTKFTATLGVVYASLTLMVDCATVLGDLWVAMVNCVI